MTGYLSWGILNLYSHPLFFCLLGYKHVCKFWLTQSDSLCSYFEIRIQKFLSFGCLFVSNLHGTPSTYPVLYWKLKVGWRPHSRVNTQQGTDERRKSGRFPFWFQISATQAETTWKWRTSKKENWTLLLWSIARLSIEFWADKISLSQITSIMSLIGGIIRIIIIIVVVVVAVSSDLGCCPVVKPDLHQTWKKRVLMNHVFFYIRWRPGARVSLTWHQYALWKEGKADRGSL